MSLTNTGAATGTKGGKEMITNIEIYELLKSKNFTQKEAEKLVTFLSEQSKSEMQEHTKVLLTKDDKLELLNRIDSHFKWLVGIMISLFSLAVALFKLL